MIVSAQNHTAPPTCAYCGAAYLVLGGVEGDRSFPDDAFATIEGSVMFSNAGTGVTFIDDWDGDGRDEVGLSAQYAEVGGMYGAGTTSVFTGGTLYP